MATRKPTKQKPVLIVQHTHYEHPASIRRALESQGIPTLVAHVYKGHKLPGVKEISGVISMGGPMSVNDEDEHSWIAKECRLLRSAITAKLPVVGVCLGGQLIAKAMGVRVGANPRPEVGWHKIELNTKGLKDPIVSAAGPKPTVYHWHLENFELPPGAELLASSAHCPRQAYRIGKQVYGFQFHPEADSQLLREWFLADDTEASIHALRSKHGAESIQTEHTQRKHAIKGEASSLKITAAIGQLFRREEYSPADGFLSEMLTVAQERQDQLCLEIVGSSGKTFQLVGKIYHQMKIEHGEFVIVQSFDGILWPIRMDDIAGISFS